MIHSTARALLLLLLLCCTTSTTLAGLPSPPDCKSAPDGLTECPTLYQWDIQVRTTVDDADILDEINDELVDIIGFMAGGADENELELSDACWTLIYNMLCVDQYGDTCTDEEDRVGICKYSCEYTLAACDLTQEQITDDEVLELWGVIVFNCVDGYQYEDDKKEICLDPIEGYYYNCDPELTNRCEEGKIEDVLGTHDASETTDTLESSSGAAPSRQHVAHWWCAGTASLRMAWHDVVLILLLLLC